MCGDERFLFSARLDEKKSKSVSSERNSLNHFIHRKTIGILIMCTNTHLKKSSQTKIFLDSLKFCTKSKMGCTTNTQMPTFASCIKRNYVQQSMMQHDTT